jgi:signal transduction histidine kinase
MLRRGSERQRDGPLVLRGRAATPAWWLAILVGTIAAGTTLIALVLTDDSLAGRRGQPLLVVAVGWAFAVSGLIAWRRRPDNRLGPAMVVLGVVWLGGQLMGESDWSPVFTAAVLVNDAWVILFIPFLLSYPHGRLASRTDRLLVALFAFAVVVLELIWLLFLELPEPGNAMLVWPDPGAADAVDTTQRVFIVAGSAAVVTVLAKRWTAASAPLRRGLTPLIAGAAVILVSSSRVVLDEIMGDTGHAHETLQWIVLVTLVCVPLAVLADLLRARLARASVGDLLVELRGNPAPAELRDALARALRDPSLQLAYWLPEFESYADLEGQPLELPEDGTTTLIDHDGERVAALLHDRSLTAEPELLASVSAAAGMAVENARLHVELRARLEELKGSRARIVEAAQTERRRLERNLHDGAQQRLVTLSLELGLLESRLDADPESRLLLEHARSELGESLKELRELARGLHPAVVTSHGLRVALEALAARAPVPVELQVQLESRLPEHQEVAAYYLVAESLTNVAKYAHASSVTIDVSRADGQLVVEVVDDGRGGASTEQGSGLRGLADRIEALDGRLRVWSPAGGGTRVRAEIPCA